MCLFTSFEVNRRLFMYMYVYACKCVCVSICVGRGRRVLGKAYHTLGKRGPCFSFESESLSCVFVPSLHERFRVYSRLEILAASG